MKTFKDYIDEGIKVKVAPHIARQRKLTKLSDDSIKGVEGADKAKQDFLAAERIKQQQKTMKDSVALKKKQLAQSNKQKKM